MITRDLLGLVGAAASGAIPAHSRQGNRAAIRQVKRAQ
jgi:hypothetical protein